MRVDKKRMKEIDAECEVIMEAMKEAEKLGDWETHQYLQDTYGKYLQMQNSIDESKKEKIGNRLSFWKIIVDFLGVLGTVFVGILGIRSACKADDENIIVNQRSWNVGTDFLKRLKR